MNTSLKSLALTVLVGTGFLGVSNKAQAYCYYRIDSLALRMERQACVLRREVHAHFRPCPQFAHLDADVAQLERLAQHIHNLAHHRGCISHIRADVEQMDRLFHHIEDLVEGISRSGAIHWREVAHLRMALNRLSFTLHALRNELNPPCHYGRYLEPGCTSGLGRPGGFVPYSGHGRFGH